MSLFSKPHSSLGVDIGAGGIKLVELRQAKNRPQLWTYALVDEALDIHVKMTPDKTPAELMAEKKPVAAKLAPAAMTDAADPRIEKYAKLIALAAETAKVAGRRVTASLPVSAVFHAVVNLPKVPERELAHHVQAKVSKLLPRPIEEMQIVQQLVPTQPSGIIPALPSADMKYVRVLVTAAPRDLVRFYTTIFQKAGLQLEELETEAFALARSLVGRDPATVMVVDIGAERTNFFIIDQGLPLIHRSIQLGGQQADRLLEQVLGIEAEKIGAVKADLSRLSAADLPADLFAPLIDPIIKEIQSSFNLFLGQMGNEGKQPEKIILTGGSAVFPPLASLLARAFPALRVFVGDPWARVVYQQGLKPLLNEVGPRMSVSIGLALRGMVAK